MVFAYVAQQQRFARQYFVLCSVARHSVKCLYRKCRIHNVGDDGLLQRRCELRLCYGQTVCIQRIAGVVVNAEVSIAEVYLSAKHRSRAVYFGYDKAFAYGGTVVIERLHDERSRCRCACDGHGRKQTSCLCLCGFTVECIFQCALESDVVQTVLQHKFDGVARKVIGICRVGAQRIVLRGSRADVFHGQSDIADGGLFHVFRFVYRDGNSSFFRLLRSVVFATACHAESGHHAHEGEA